MIFFSYYSVITFSNCYLLGREGSRDALLIDAGVFDEGLLRLVEDNSLNIRHVLITHVHQAHVNGLGTLRKIYDAALWTFEPKILEFPARKLPASDVLELAGFEVQVLETPGHSSDSVCYRIDGLLFTGDALCAGSIGRTEGPYERAILLSSIRSRILTLGDGTLVFPGHGPPTTIGLERRVNPDLRESQPSTA